MSTKIVETRLMPLDKNVHVFRKQNFKEKQENQMKKA